MATPHGFARGKLVESHLLCADLEGAVGLQKK